MFQREKVPAFAFLERWNVELVQLSEMVGPKDDISSDHTLLLAGLARRHTPCARLEHVPVESIRLEPGNLCRLNLFDWNQATCGTPLCSSYVAGRYKRDEKPLWIFHLFYTLLIIEVYASLLQPFLLCHKHGRHTEP